MYLICGLDITKRATKLFVLNTADLKHKETLVNVQQLLGNLNRSAGLSLSFESTVVLFSTLVANLLLCGSILSTTGNFTHSIKGKSIILNHNNNNTFFRMKLKRRTRRLALLQGLPPNYIKILFTTNKII